ncbi:MAG: tRNA guanosine(34) transglycosylase Tgt [bacterium]
MTGNDAATTRDRIAFTLEATDPATGARAGILHTPHGDVPTPVFMPVGTLGAVKTLAPADLEEIGARIILANTYHLFLRPGEALVRDLGGMHRFASWERAMLTDSGGFQVMSLSELNTITNEGVEFRSHLDGSRHFLTPERAMDVQLALGADIIMAFDQCARWPATWDEANAAHMRTLAWTARSRARVIDQQGDVSGRSSLFGIVQGATYPDLRRESALAITGMDFPGYAIGGLSVGEPKEAMFETLPLVTALLPAEKPRYLMGVGFPEDLLEGIARGVDMFDCVMPTRNARKGTVFTSRGRLVVKNAAYARDDSPLDPECTCSTCRRFSRAYLRHLFQVGEMLAMRLASLHSLAFYLDLMRRAREAILAGRYDAFRKETLGRMRGDV